MRLKPYVVQEGFFPNPSQSALKVQPMVRKASKDFALKNGGKILNDFLTSFVPWDDCVVDSKLVMVKPGWYPAIPGWHLDAAPRGEDGLPTLQANSLNSEHIALNIGVEVPTMYLLEELDLPEKSQNSKEEGPIYKIWDRHIKNIDGLDVALSYAGDVIRFDGKSLHRCSESRVSGWRMFIRASRNTGRLPANEMRTQVQVYMNGLDKAGW